MNGSNLVQNNRPNGKVFKPSKKCAHFLDEVHERQRFKPCLLCYLFDSLVRPVADYDCEVWRHTRAELEIIHRRFCKFALGVPRTTSNLILVDIHWILDGK